MTYTLEQLSSDIKAALKADPGPGGKEAVCKLVSKVCLDKEFIAKHLTPENCKPRRVLYEDPETGFCVCGHVYMKPAHGEPHDHGSSWAIYGLAEGDTEMTDWKVVREGDGTDADPGRAGEGLHAAPGRRALLRRARHPFAQPRHGHEAGAHRRQQPRPHQAVAISRRHRK